MLRLKARQIGTVSPLAVTIPRATIAACQLLRMLCPSTSQDLPGTCMLATARASSSLIRVYQAQWPHVYGVDGLHVISFLEQYFGFCPREGKDSFPASSEQWCDSKKSSLSRASVMMYIAHDIHCSCMVKHLPSYVHRHYTRAMTTHMHWFPSILTKDLVQLSSSCRPGMLFLRCLAVGLWILIRCRLRRMFFCR